MEASRIAEMDVRARARAIRSAKARAEFFCCFFMWRRGGDGPGELEVSRANFFLEEESFRTLGTLSQAKSTTAITSKHATTSVMMQACGCRAKLFEKLIETKARRTANTNKCAFGEAFFLRLYWIVRSSRLGVGCRAGASPARQPRRLPYNSVVCRRSVIFCRKRSTSSGLRSQ